MALFSYRTDELKDEVIQELFSETVVDRQIIDKIKDESPVILEGSRGSGKSFLLKISEIELRRDFERDRILPVYLSFKMSSLVQAGNRNQFLYWMMARLCAQTVRSFREWNFISPEASSFILLKGRATSSVGDLEAVAAKFEDSWRHPGEIVDTNSVPDIYEFIEAVEQLCRDNNVERVCLIFDEAAHAFRPEQQHAFFSLFRDLRSPFITCNAAVYPGITSYGPAFEMNHDATLIRLERDIEDPNYIGLMREIVTRQAARKQTANSSEDRAAANKLLAQAAKGGNFDKMFPLLGYSAHGNPRHLLKTVGMLTDFKASNSETVVKAYYRQDIWKEHTALGDKFPILKPVVDWGRDFVEETLLPSLQERNENPETRGTRETTIFFWISRDAPAEIKMALAVLSYVGLVQELDKAYRGTRSQLGTRYAVHFGALLSLAAHPGQELENVLPSLAKKRMIEFGKNHSVYSPLAVTASITGDMMPMSVVTGQLTQSVEQLDLTLWQKTVLMENGFTTIGEILTAGEETIRAKIYMVGEVRARVMMNAAKAAILEYLIG